MSGKGKRLKRTLAARRVETKMSPIPDTPKNTNWQRRFTWLVQVGLADPLAEESMTPEEAGKWAKEIVKNEFAQEFPDEEVPSWMV